MAKLARKAVQQTKKLAKLKKKLSFLSIFAKTSHCNPRKIAKDSSLSCVARCHRWGLSTGRNSVPTPRPVQTTPLQSYEINTFSHLAALKKDFKTNPYAGLNRKCVNLQGVQWLSKVQILNDDRGSKKKVRVCSCIRAAAGCLQCVLLCLNNDSNNPCK